MDKLNNKGYMLIEIILATALAMGVGYFLIELTLKVKNTNDDLLVESLVKTDQGIIYNMVMKDVYKNKASIADVSGKLTVEPDKNRITYDEKVIIVTDYAQIGTMTKTGNKITIPIAVKQLPDDNFDVVMYFAN